MFTLKHVENGFLRLLKDQEQIAADVYKNDFTGYPNCNFVDV